jgi:hypothetical protein
MGKLMLAIAAALLIAFAIPASAQWNVQQMPLGGGWQQYNGYGPNGQSFNATRMPMGGGWSSTNCH